MKELSLHLLDLAENSLAAGAQTVKISVCEDLEADQLILSIEDNGRGMDEETLHKVVDPFYTTRTTRKVGLGIPLLKDAAESCHGQMEITSKPGAGTRVEVTFQHSHIDRMPLGNLPDTFLTLSAAHPDVHWVFDYTARNTGAEEVFDYEDQPIKETLDGLPITHPQVLAFVRQMLEDGVTNAQKILDGHTTFTRQESGQKGENQYASR